MSVALPAPTPRLTRARPPSGALPASALGNGPGGCVGGVLVGTRLVMSGLVVGSGLFVVTDSPSGAATVGGSGFGPGSGAGVRGVAGVDCGGGSILAASAGTTDVFS